MTRGNVARFVSEHAGELCLGSEQIHPASRDVNEASRPRKPVRRRIVDDVKLPGQVGSFGASGELQADARDVGLQLAIVDEADGLGHLLRRFFSNLNFLRLRGERELWLAGRRVQRARRNEYAR